MRRRQHSSSHVELALRRTLVRQPPPADMTERIMAGIREDSVRVPAGGARYRWLPRPSMRLAWAVAGCACAAAWLFTVDLPVRDVNRNAERIVLQGVERDLAEVLHLAGNKWNQAREAAFSPGLDEDYD